MGQPAARQGDRIVALDMHLVQPPGTSPPALVPHPFSGIIDGAVSSDVKIGGAFAATVDSTATNTPPHVPMIPGSFVNPPSNKATITLGSKTVTINGKAAARAGDTATTCNDPSDLPAGTVVAAGQVLIGG
jgi:uncharacterized Zn-binding protein involved in type VI secretion